MGHEREPAGANYSKSNGEYVAKGAKTNHKAKSLSPPTYNASSSASRIVRGSKKNIKAFVSSQSGIRLHTTPSPVDPDYVKKKGKSASIIKRKTIVEILSESNGWAKIKHKTLGEGYIEKRNLREIKKTQLDNLIKKNYLTSKGDMLEPIIKKYYSNYNFQTGNDQRTILEAIVCLNRGVRSNAIKYTLGNEEVFLNGLKRVVDPNMNNARKLYQTAQLRENEILRLPTIAYIDLLKANGQLNSRPMWMNTVIKVGRLDKGFRLGLKQGFVQAIGDTFNDLKELIRSIISGKLFKSIWDLVKKLFNEGPRFIFNVFKDFISGTYKDVIAALKNPNPEQKGNFFGKIIGKILFEVAVAYFTAGVGNAIRHSPKLIKIKKFLPNLRSVEKKLAVVIKKKRIGIKRSRKNPNGKNKIPPKNKKLEQSGQKSGFSIARDLKYKQPPKGHHWYKKSNGELGVRRNKGYNGPKKAFKLDKDGKHILNSQGEPVFIDVGDSVLRAQKENIEKVKVPDLDKSKQTKLQKLIAERKAAAARKKKAGDGTQAKKDANKDMRNASYEMGEFAADSYMRQRGGTRVFPPEGDKVGGKSRAGEFDQVWELDGELVIVEAKGGTAGLGTKKVGAKTVQQGTREYMEAIIADLKDKTLKRKLEKANITGKLRYYEIKMKVTSSGDLGDISVKKFNI